MKKSSVCLLLALGGAVVGAAVAILVTPQSGKELRGKLRTAFNEAQHKMSIVARGFSCCSGSPSLQALKLRLTDLAAPCHMGSELCHQGLNPRPLHWKVGSQ